jgi:hypothetical protein
MLNQNGSYMLWNHRTVVKLIDPRYANPITDKVPDILIYMESSVSVKSVDLVYQILKRSF